MLATAFLTVTTAEGGAKRVTRTVEDLTPHTVPEVRRLLVHPYLAPATQVISVLPWSGPSGIGPLHHIARDG